MIKKLLKFFTSMPFAIGILVLLAIACALSSTVSQGLSYEAYAAQYGERVAGLILALRLDDAFHSWWFIGLSAILCLNLLFCNLIRFPALLRRTRSFGNVEKTLGTAGRVCAEGNGNPEDFFRRMHIGSPKKESDPEGKERYVTVQHRAGFWGPWVCHLGILLLVLGFALSQGTMFQTTVYGLPGQTKALGETGLQVTVEEFRAEKNEDGSPAQFSANLTVADPATGRQESGTTAVNAPASLFGYTFFQNSYGWGADIRVRKDGADLQTAPLCAGDFLPVQDKPDLVIYFQAFYPDYQLVEGYGPANLSENLNHPAYLYRVYYQSQLLGMNVLEAGEELTIDEYTVTFENPRYYSLLAVKRDRFSWLVLLGALVTLLGLVLAFYLRPAAFLAQRDKDHGWLLAGVCPKGGAIFRETFEKAARESGFIPCGETSDSDGKADPMAEQTPGRTTAEK